MSLQGKRVDITGIVQGVGFRPFVYALAKQFELTGWIRNTSGGVEIEVGGKNAALDAFVETLQQKAPPMAYIEKVIAKPCQVNGHKAFEIVPSQSIAGAFQPISPDVGICADCLRELFDPGDRHYRYPFTNCTNCGPRFTIIEDVPYDRPNTSMADFAMCEECAKEYQDPSDRRFHAQPVACPACGPQIRLEVNGKTIGKWEEALQLSRQMLMDGQILAVKGLGGFHLACDASNSNAVEELRKRKRRKDKPLAVMLPDEKTVVEACVLSDEERELLASNKRPIVILETGETKVFAPQIAPGQNTIGAMLPYTPLHYLLIEPAPDFPNALVMTSANLPGEPIIKENEDASAQLAEIADGVLMHDRNIRIRCDDSVLRVFKRRNSIDVSSKSTKHYLLRRSRGYAPFPVYLPWTMPSITAVGGELKNTFCLTREQYAFLSQHIGEMESYGTLQAFEESINHFERLFRLQPVVIAHDLHPDYAATRYALRRVERENLTAIGVQHHHAHIAACMAEHGLDGSNPVIGVAFDGSGYGDDGAIWGGEFLIADYHHYKRAYHLKYVPLLGGEAAIRQPSRMALAWLAKTSNEWSDDLAPVQYFEQAEKKILLTQMTSNLNAIPTSSMGRLFDAIASLIGIRQEVSYEAQAAIELENLADPGEEGHYPFAIQDSTIDPSPLISQTITDLRKNTSTNIISARFHNGVAEMVRQICEELRRQNDLSQVVLSGGVWQNMLLLEKTIGLLSKAGFEVFFHRKVPANDGGLALGQAAVASHRFEG